MRALGRLAWVACSLALACNRPAPEPEPAPAPAPGPAPVEASGFAVEPPPSTWALPPDDVVRIVDAPPTPLVVPDPRAERLAIVSHPALPSLALLAEPLVGLAGIRINPRRNEQQRTLYYDSITIAPVDGGPRVRVQTPEGARLGAPSWSPDAAQLAFTVTVDDGVQLWVASSADGQARRLLDAHLNTALGDGFSWSGDGQSLLAMIVPERRSQAPAAPPLPAGPIVEETAGRSATNPTYQDLLRNAHDEALFEHYFTSQLVRVSLSGQRRALGAPGIHLDVEESPDHAWLLVHEVRRPYSRLVPYYRFAHTVEVWDAESGEAHRVLADLPAAEEVPIEGVPTGMRAAHWRPTAPATVVWVEALDGGDPGRKAEHRDALWRQSAPFHEPPAALVRLSQRYAGLHWLADGARVLVTEYDRDRRWITTHLAHVDEGAATLDRVIFDRSIHDSYGDPGEPVYTQLPSGKLAVRVDDDHIHLAGSGATPKGDRPFLDRRSLLDATHERVFHAPADAYASFVAFAGDDPARLIVRRESPSQPPNYFLREGAPEGAHERALTDFPHPHPQLSSIDKQLLTYRRRDGVPLSGTLYLPPDRRPGEKLPLVVWAYPREYVSEDTAGQVRAAPSRFTRLASTSPLMFVTQGYAVLDDAAMPIVGDPKTMNDTFVEQITWDAQAAIDAVDRLGVVDRDRVGIAGHSYGAFMAANLLAWTDLFRAGIARSGAYNRTLTPFGFQSERRTLWEAPDAYMRVSPLLQAHALDEPILLVHGEIDDNSGTFPLQSQRLFHALQGLGGTAKLVVLPHESHGYRARESVLHVLAESFDWLDRHVKHAGPRTPKPPRRPAP